MKIVTGLAEVHRARAAELFWKAFRGKLGRILWPERKALLFLAEIIQPDFAISAVENGTLLGVAGFKTSEGGFLAGNFSNMAHHYGWLSTSWRGPLLELFERKLVAGQLLMDGIFVAEEARGHGVGSAIIEALKTEAITRGYREIRLDVVAGNNRARRLYERYGFEAVGEMNTGILAPVMGFRRATTMVVDLTPGPLGTPSITTHPEKG